MLYAFLEVSCMISKGVELILYCLEDYAFHCSYLLFSEAPRRPESITRITTCVKYSRQTIVLCCQTAFFSFILGREEKGLVNSFVVLEQFCSGNPQLFGDFTTWLLIGLKGLLIGVKKWEPQITMALKNSRS